MDLTIEDFRRTDPDNLQFGRKVREEVYHFREFDRLNYSSKFEGFKWMPTELMEEAIVADFNSSEFWIDEEVNLHNYSLAEIESLVSAYYDSLDALKEIYGDDSEFIIAECIFEQENGLY